MKSTGSRFIRIYSDFCQRDAGPVPVSGGDALLGFLLRRWRANAGKSCPAILAAKRRKGRLNAMGFTIPPAQRWGHPATREAAASRRWQNSLCLGEHNRPGQSNEGPRKRLPLGSLFLRFAKTVPRFLPARPEHPGRTTHKAGESTGAETLRQSRSRRSPTAPFAQGSHLCLGEHNRSGRSNEGPRKRLPLGSLFLRFAKTVPRLLPAWPEHSGRTTHKAGESMGAASRCSGGRTGPVPGRSFRSLPRQIQPATLNDCTRAG